MSVPLCEHLEEVGASVGGAPRILLFLDYDGTLTPLVSSPSAAFLAPSVRANLARLAGSRGARLAILSGRRLADLRARVALGGVLYGGCHGLEMAGRRIGSLPGRRGAAGARQGRTRREPRRDDCLRATKDFSAP